MSFNPRPREGGDGRVFIVRDLVDAFQSTPPRGGRLNHVPAIARWSSFNPRPREGGDPLRPVKPMASRVFQSTPPRGGRQGKI